MERSSYYRIASVLVLAGTAGIGVKTYSEHQSIGTSEAEAAAYADTIYDDKTEYWQYRADFHETSRNIGFLAMGLGLTTSFMIHKMAENKTPEEE